MAVTGLVLPAELETEAQLHFETYWGFGRGYRRIDFSSVFFESDRMRGCPVWEIGPVRTWHSGERFLKRLDCSTSD
jgi:hypothetical protein